MANLHGSEARASGKGTGKISGSQPEKGTQPLGRGGSEEKWKEMAENFSEAFASDSVHTTYRGLWEQVREWAKADKLPEPENVRIVQKITMGEKGTEVEVEFSIFADGKEISAKKRTVKKE